MTTKIKFNHLLEMVDHIDNCENCDVYDVDSLLDFLSSDPDETFRLTLYLTNEVIEIKFSQLHKVVEHLHYKCENYFGDLYELLAYLECKGEESFYLNE